MKSLCIPVSTAKCDQTQFSECTNIAFFVYFLKKGMTGEEIVVMEKKNPTSKSKEKFNSVLRHE